LRKTLLNFIDCKDTHTAGALGGTRTPNLLIRSQMLYPLSYKRWENFQLSFQPESTSK
jgi:hypothetical protein